MRKTAEVPERHLARISMSETLPSNTLMLGLESRSGYRRSSFERERTRTFIVLVGEVSRNFKRLRPTLPVAPKMVLRSN